MTNNGTYNQKNEVRFGYDPLGRRISKEVKGVRTNWLWDGNVPLHEWQSHEKEPLIDLITWVFEDGGFVPVARLTADGSQSIQQNPVGPNNKNRQKYLDAADSNMPSKKSSHTKRMGSH